MASIASSEASKAAPPLISSAGTSFISTLRSFISSRARLPSSFTRFTSSIEDIAASFNALNSSISEDTAFQSSWVYAFNVRNLSSRFRPEFSAERYKLSVTRYESSKSRCVFSYLRQAFSKARLASSAFSAQAGKVNASINAKTIFLIARFSVSNVHADNRGHADRAGNNASPGALALLLRCYEVRAETPPGASYQILTRGKVGFSHKLSGFRPLWPAGVRAAFGRRPGKPPPALRHRPPSTSRALPYPDALSSGAAFPAGPAINRQPQKGLRKAGISLQKVGAFLWNNSIASLTVFS